jgi:serine/threonine protein kinase
LNDLFLKQHMTSPLLLPPSSPTAIFRITSVTDFTDSDHSPTDSPVELRWKGRGRAPERTPSPRRRRSGAGRRYRRGKRLQEPHLSEVRVGEDTKHGDRRVVLKEPFRPWMVAAELAALKRLQPHPSIVTLLDFFDDKGATFLVFKFVPGMDLLDWLDIYFASPRPAEQAAAAEVESEMQPLARQLALALRYCHEHGVAHRDVKPDNVRVDPLNQHVTLIDFGLAYVTEHDMDARLRVGSLDYAAPEIRRSRSSSTPKGVDDIVDPFKCDVWSLGVTLHAMTHYELPFCRGKVGTRVGPAEHFSPALRAAINTLLTEDPKARPDMKAAVELEWFRTEGTTEEA